MLDREHRLVAKLIFRSGMYAGKNMSLPEGKAIVLGRNRDVDLPLNDAKLSRRHCRITATEAGCIIVDFSSTNGTFVNGNRLVAEKQMELIEFDRIVLGDTEIELYVSDPTERILAVSSDDNMPIVRMNDDNTSKSKQIQSSTRTMKAVSMEDSDLEIKADPDPLLAALYEMGLPLPPEPPLANGMLARNEPTYCSYCGSKIPEEEKVAGIARMISNKLACKVCLAKPLVAQGHSANPEVDAMLAALDGEPTVVDMNKRSRATVFERDSELGRKVLAHTPPKSSEPQVFGEEFEEIG